MKRWEFLIQQEGQPTWQPISQTTWEGEAGNYRLVAHSDRPHLDVEIHIVHETMAGAVTHRQAQKHSRRTNSEGLITILPLTDLQPGSWEIRCYGDLMDELLGQGWQESIRLQVCPQPALLAEAPISMTESSEIPEFSTFFPEFEPENELPLLAVEETANTAQLPELRLILEQDALIRDPGAAVSLTGKVEAAEVAGAHFAGKLRLELTEPAFPDVLCVREYPLPEQPLPLSFDCTLDLPADWEIPLLQGELLLVAADGSLLARQALTIATDLNVASEAEPGHLNYTIELASTEDHSSFSFDLLIPEEVAATPLPLKLVEPLKMQSQPRLASPASSRALPPKLSRSRPPQRQAPQLPKLPPKPQPVAAPPGEGMSDNQPNWLPNRENLPAAAAEANSAPSVAQAFPAAPGLPAATAQPKLSQRFLSRLNSLATGS